MDRSTLKFFSIILVALFIVAGTGAYLFLKSKGIVGSSAERAAYRYFSAIEAGKSGNLPQTADELERLQEKYGNTMTNDQIIKMKFSQAGIFTLLGQNEKAVLVYREIVANPLASPLQKAVAVNSLADFYYRGMGDEFMRANVFSGERYGELLKKADGNVAVAVKSMYEFSNSLEPTPLSSYRLSIWYATGLRLALVPSGKENIYREAASSWLAQGNSIFTEFLKSRPDATTIAYLRHTKGLAMWYAGNYDNAEGEFKEALRLGTEDSGNAILFSSNLFTRFVYAMMLTDEYYRGERNEDIREIVQPLVSRTQFMDQKFVFFEKFLPQASSPGSAEYPYYLKLTALVPELKTAK